MTVCNSRLRVLAAKVHCGVSSPRFDFTGKSVLVTGASRGIGHAVASAFAEAGADLTILADDAAVNDTARRLQDLCGRPVRGLQCDVADRDAVRAAIGHLERVDVLINNAGREAMTPIREKGEAVELAFRRVIDVNVLGVFYVTRDVIAEDGSRRKNRVLPHRYGAGRLLRISALIALASMPSSDSCARSPKSLVRAASALTPSLPAGCEQKCRCAR